ncbi:arginase [Xylanibacillus composti]|uniref:Arginase n=1 Tax=Xylanibacillus composti TaxID=1572762 RepID=A0A8J4M1G9_9BACL|nr:arginase [Xylanibacillus composti]
MKVKQKTVSILSVPFDLGAGRKGVHLSPNAILQAGLEQRLADAGVSCVLEGEVVPPSTGKGKQNTADNLKNLEEVVTVNEKLADRVEAVVRKGQFPLVLGGDHSIAIGTLSGLTRHYKNLGVIWFDAHSDLNTAETSPSGNIHGMSLAVGLGMGDPRLTKIKEGGHPIKSKHVVIIGARSIDEGEKAYINDSGVTCFTMHDIDQMGMEEVIAQTLDLLRDTTDGIHLSFDVDSLDPLEAPGTGTPVKGGVSYREAQFALRLLHESGLITSAEFVEVNPTLESDNATAEVALEFIASLLGEQIL